MIGRGKETFHLPNGYAWWNSAKEEGKRENMKKIGLVGGTGPESTIMYYKELNSQIDKATNGKICQSYS